MIVRRDPAELEAVSRCAELALAAIHREYPSHIVHLLRSDSDARPPRALTPAFYGSFDWHSAVHGHWCLVRALRHAPGAPFQGRAREALSESLTPVKIRGEVGYLGAEGRTGFERPYGLAWLLQLAAELREWRADADAALWLEALEPLEALAVNRLRLWLPKLRWPVRSGVHGQSAFAMGLVLDWARVAGSREMEALIRSRATDFYAGDASAPIDYEPSGHDFLSPVLGEADLMRRVLAKEEFASWLLRFLPDLDGPAARAWLIPVEVSDSADGHLAHLDGLNLSRAWMLEGIASGLPADDPRVSRLLRAALSHREAGLAAVTGEHYAGGHWLGTFGTYLVTQRGRDAAREPA